jgi:hypothetical protein
VGGGDYSDVDVYLQLVGLSYQDRGCQHTMLAANLALWDDQL